MVAKGQEVRVGVVIKKKKKKKARKRMATIDELASSACPAAKTMLI